MNGKKVELDYFKDLKYIFELRNNVKRYIDSGEPLGRKGNLKSDISILLKELEKLEKKVK